MSNVISPSGTRHILGPRGATLCGFTVWPSEARTEAQAVRDCQFCIEELHEIAERERRKAQRNKAAEWPPEAA